MSDHVIEITAPDVIEILPPAEVIEVQVGAVGPPGPAGVPAPPINQHFTAPASTWTVTHNRGTYPDVVLITDSDGTERVFTDVTYPDLNTAVATWPSPTTGWASIQ